MHDQAIPTRLDVAAAPAALAVHAIVPMKDLARAKSRLAGCLSPPERRALAEALLQHVLATLSLLVRAGHLRALWVVSSDATVLQAAAAAGACPLPDSTAELNAALHLAQASAEQAGAEALLIIPADVPLLTAADVLALVAALAAGRAAGSQAAGVIVPSRDGSGTNALGVTLPTPLPFQFGSSSFARHQESARRLGMHLHVHTSPTLALDIDTPEDLAHLEHEQQHRERKEVDGNHWICCGT